MLSPTTILSNSYYLYGICESPPKMPVTMIDLWELPIQYVSYQDICLLYSEVDEEALEKLQQPITKGFSTKDRYQWLLMAFHRQDWHLLPFQYHTMIEESPMELLYRNGEGFLKAYRASKGVCEYQLSFAFDDHYSSTKLFSKPSPKKRQQMAALKAMSIMRLLRGMNPTLDVSLKEADLKKPNEVSLSILVSIEEAESLRKACQTVQNNYSQLTLKVTGPWPPYRLMPEYELEPKEKEESSLFSFLSF